MVKKRARLAGQGVKTFFSDVSQVEVEQKPKPKKNSKETELLEKIRALQALIIKLRDVSSPEEFTSWRIRDLKSTMS